MQNIVEELKSIINNSNIKIKDTINIKDVNNLMLSIEENKPIPISFYNKTLIELKNNKNKCSLCKRSGQYSCENNFYCWVHAHSLN